MTLFNHGKGYLALVGYVHGICMGQEFRDGNVSPGGGDFSFHEEV